MKRIIAIALLLVMALSLVACGASEAEKPVFTEADIPGTWVMGNMKQEFKADGTGVLMMASGITMASDWVIKDGKLIVGYAMGEVEMTITKNEDGTLVLHYNGGDYTKAP